MSLTCFSVIEIHGAIFSRSKAIWPNYLTFSVTSTLTIVALFPIVMTTSMWSHTSPAGHYTRSHKGSLDSSRQRSTTTIQAGNERPHQ